MSEGNLRGAAGRLASSARTRYSRDRISTKRPLRAFVCVGATALIASGLLLASLTIGAGASTASDQAKAKKHLLVLSDMPTGWKTEKGSTGSTSGNGPLSDFPGGQQLASCVGVPLSVLASNPPQATSPYFEDKTGALEVQDSVSVFSSTNNASTEYAAVNNVKLSSCLTATVNTASFKSQFSTGTPKGTTIGTIAVTAINPAHYGRNTAGFTINNPCHRPGGLILDRDHRRVFHQGQARSDDLLQR